MKPGNAVEWSDPNEKVSKKDCQTCPAGVIANTGDDWCYSIVAVYHTSLSWDWYIEKYEM